MIPYQKIKDYVKLHNRLSKKILFKIKRMMIKLNLNKKLSN